MKTFLKSSVLLGLFAFSVSCGNQVKEAEYVTLPFLYPESTPFSFPEPPADVKKNILLEDFTGHQCGYCPGAAKKITELLEIPKYAERVIPVAVYCSGPFNTHFPNADKFYYDFTTKQGIEVDLSYGMSSSLPNGLVNRTAYNNEVIVGFPKWQQAIDKQLEEPAVAWVDVHTSYSNDDNRYLTIDSRVKMLENYPNPINLNVVVIENGIVNWQKDYSQDPSEVEDYVHNHVLRYNNDVYNRNLFGTWGIDLKSNQAGADEIKRVTTTLNSTDWNINNLYAIAYIYDATTREILQVNKTKISM